MKSKTIALFILAVGILSIPTAMGQELRPTWVDGGLRDLEQSYIEVVQGEGRSIEAARDRAATVIVQRRNLTVGQRTDVHVQDGHITTKGDQTILVTARILDEYSEPILGAGYRVYLLVQTLKHPMNHFEQVSVSDRYPASYRTFLPGATQLQKGQVTKGMVIIGAEVALVGGIVAFEGLRSSYEVKIPATHNAQQKAVYIDRTNSCANMRNICIAGAAAAYLWNVIDALVAKGPRYVSVADAKVSAMPYTSINGGIGLALNINF